MQHKVHVLRTIIQTVLIFNFLAWHVPKKSENCRLAVLRHPTVLYLSIPHYIPHLLGCLQFLIDLCVDSCACPFHSLATANAAEPSKRHITSATASYATASVASPTSNAATTLARSESDIDSRKFYHMSVSVPIHQH